MKVRRRSFIGIGLGTAAAVLFPELANADRRLPVRGSAGDEVPWQWRPRDARAATDEERARYLPLFERDLERIEASYGERMPGDPLSMSIATSAHGTIVALGAALMSSRVYARHMEFSPDGKVSRSATTTFTVSEAGKNMTLHSIGPDAWGAVASRAQFDARAASAKACPPGKHSCRTCSDLNAGGVLACCGGCAFAGGNPVMLLACAIIMCSVCASQNCRRWTYACCGT